MLSSKNKSSRVLHSRQEGVAILVITVLLLLVATIGTLMIGRVGLMEQKAVGVDVRNKEVYSAASGGLEAAKDWLEENWNSLVWNDADGDGNAEAGDTLSTAFTLSQASLNADNYRRTVTFTLLTNFTESINDPPVIVRIDSTATGGGDAQSGDTHITKTISQEVMIGRVMTFPGDSDPYGTGVFTGPPILIEGCTDASNTITGQPDIIYDYPDGVAVGSTSGVDSDGDGAADQSAADCVDIADINNHLNLCDDNGTCEDADDFVAGGGEFRDGIDPPQSLWSTIFGDLSEADLRELEEANPSHVHFVDSTYPHYPEQPQTPNLNNWHDNLPTGFTASGPSAGDEPVILYFDESVGCPSINGGTAIYGLVYFEKVDCGNNGWGGGVIYGTVAKSGDLQKFNANAVVIKTDLDFGGTGTGTGGTTPGGPPGSLARFSEIPGTWRDF